MAEQTHTSWSGNDGTTLHEDDYHSESDPETELVSILETKGFSALAANNHNEAEKCLSKALELAHSKSKIGHEHIKAGLAAAYCFQMNWDAADAMLSPMSDSRSKLDILALECLHTIAMAMKEWKTPDSLEAGMRLCKKAMIGKKKLLGKSHQSYYLTVDLMGSLCVANEQHTEGSAWRELLPADWHSVRRRSQSPLEYLAQHVGGTHVHPTKATPLMAVPGEWPAGAKDVQQTSASENNPLRNKSHSRNTTTTEKEHKDKVELPKASARDYIDSAQDFVIPKDNKFCGKCSQLIGRKYESMNGEFYHTSCYASLHPAPDNNKKVEFVKITVWVYTNGVQDPPTTPKDNKFCAKCFQLISQRYKSMNGESYHISCYDSLHPTPDDQKRVELVKISTWVYINSVQDPPATSTDKKFCHKCFQLVGRQHRSMDGDFYHTGCFTSLFGVNYPATARTRTVQPKNTVCYLPHQV